MIRQPQIQTRAEDLLNLYQNHQFSFNHEQSLQIFKRVARAIPMNSREGGQMAGSVKFAFRSREDPRFTDRRMQNILRKLDENFDKFDSKGVTAMCKYIYLFNFSSVLHSKAQIPGRQHIEEMH